MENKKGFITENQMKNLIIGTILGTEILFIPNIIVEYGRQSGYLFVILGLIYPLFIVFMGSYLCKKHPNDNVLILSKKYFGNTIGTVLNSIFLFEFIFYCITRCAQLKNLLQVFVVYFLNPEIIISTIILICAYGAYSGIKPILRANGLSIFSYLMILVPLGAIGSGHINNLLPIFTLDSPNIFKAVITGFNSYFGIEILLLFYPLMKNKKDFKKSGIKSSIIMCIFLTLFIVMTIYTLGIDIIPKYLWSFVQTTKTLRLTIVKNFVFIFIFFWTILAIRSITNIYYSSCIILKSLVSKFSTKQYSITLIPLVFYFSLLLETEVSSRGIYSTIAPLLTLFNILYVSLIALLIYAKKGK